MDIILLFALIALSGISLFLGTFLIILLRDNVIADVPFVPTTTKATRELIEMIRLGEKDVFYDLGCGDGRVLIEMQRKYPLAKYIGVENGVIPYLKMKWRARNLPIEIRNQNIFSADLKLATHIYCFLSVKTNERLAPKLLAECKQGTTIISCDFPVPLLQLETTMTVNGSEGKLGRTLYAYKI